MSVKRRGRRPNSARDMSVTGTHGVGLPIILLHDAEGAVVTVELKDGSLYRGILDEAQDNMNCTIKVIF